MVTDVVSEVVTRVLVELLADGEWKPFGSLAALVVAKTAFSEGAVNMEITRGLTAGKYVRNGTQIRLRD